MIANASGALSLPVPTVVVGSTDARTIQMKTLLKQELDSQRSRHRWSMLTTDQTDTLGTATNSVASNTLPADFQRFASDTKIYHVSRRTPFDGPISPEDWQALTLGSTSLSSLYWRKTGSQTIKLAGVATGDQINYFYVSSYVIADSGGTPKVAFTADTDVSRMPENLAELGLMWRWLQANNLDYAESMSNYEREFERLATEDRGMIREQRMTPVVTNWNVNLPAVFG